GNASAEGLTCDVERVAMGGPWLLEMPHQNWHPTAVSVVTRFQKPNHVTEAQQCRANRMLLHEDLARGNASVDAFNGMLGSLQLAPCPEHDQVRRVLLRD